MKINNFSKIVTGTALVLMVPLVAMLFTDEVNWGFLDFVVIGTLLIGAGVFFELLTSRLDQKYRPVAAVVTVAAVLLIWVELAVGIFD